ncbi:MAG: Gldg family protein [Candidatus Marinimicrobia bacterium]|nr:Gldg family protein [Candidatus Neomarinimicrobiota bacterium]
MKKITNLRTFLIYLALVAGMLILANLVSRRLFFRWDLTENNIYTLSASSKAIIAKLDDRLLAKVFFSDNLPGQYANNRRYLQDILEEFQAYSKGQLHFEFYRPEDNDELESEAQRYGIPPMQLQAIENDRMEIKNVWMGLALLYEDKREVLPVIQTTSGLEYELASAIKKLIDTDRRSVGIAADPRWDGKNQNIRRVLGQTYNVRTVNLDQPVPIDIDLLLVNGVMDSLPATNLYNLDQYVMSGRPLLLAQNQVEVNLSRGRGQRIRSNFPDLLRHYGVEIKPNIIADRISGQVAVETQRGIFRMRNTVDYPFFPRIQRFNADHVVVAGLEEVRLVFASEVTGAIDSSRAGTARFEPLMTTSEFTAVMREPFFNFSFENNPVFQQLNGPGRAVAGLLRGEVTSYFTEDTQPEEATGFIPATMGAQLLVIGDGTFFSDESGAIRRENLELVLNAVDYLVGDEELIAIRSREVTTRPLKELSDGTRRSLKWANILGPSMLIVATGLWRWRSNRKRRTLLEQIYGH